MNLITLFTSVKPLMRIRSARGLEERGRTTPEIRRSAGVPLAPVPVAPVRLDRPVAECSPPDPPALPHSRTHALTHSRTSHFRTFALPSIFPRMTERPLTDSREARRRAILDSA